MMTPDLSDFIGGPVTALKSVNVDERFNIQSLNSMDIVPSGTLVLPIYLILRPATNGEFKQIYLMYTGGRGDMQTLARRVIYFEWTDIPDQWMTFSKDKLPEDRIVLFPYIKPPVSKEFISSTALLGNFSNGPIYCIGFMVHHDLENICIGK